MTTPTPGSWDPINEYDNFNAPAVTDPDPRFTYPQWQLDGVEPATTGIPADNATYYTMKLGRVIAQGTTQGTWMVRTTEGWLLDNLFPHVSYSIGQFVFLLVCGTWCLDISMTNYLPPTPPTPNYTSNGTTATV